MRVKVENLFFFLIMLYYHKLCTRESVGLLDDPYSFLVLNPGDAKDIRVVKY